MKKIQKSFLIFSFAILLVIGAIANSQNIYGKTKGYRLIGSVLSIDSETHTIKVKDRASKQIYTVRVPANSQIKLAPCSATGGDRSFVDLERLMQGFVVDVWVSN